MKEDDFISIGGCSFSERIPYELHDSVWKPWVCFLEEDRFNFQPPFNILTNAVSSSGNSKIVDSILESLVGNPRTDPSVDFLSPKPKYVIVQWSAVSRGYSNNETDFTKKIIKFEDYNLFNYEEELVSKELEYGTVTDRLNHVSFRYYQYSLHKILLLKNYLENNNIPYLFFWGWQQLTDDLIKKYNLSKLVDLIYDGNWWRHGTHGGFSEYVVEKFGKESALIPNDFHPTTQSHEYFYNTVIKNEIKKLTSRSYISDDK